MKNTSSRLHILVALSLALLAPRAFADDELTVTALRCDEQTEPVGIDRAAPALSWQMRSTRRAVMQTAYQILVATRPELLTEPSADLWNSGRVASDQSSYVVYAGKPLQSSTQYHWQVRVWDERGNATAWSQPGSFTTGLLSPDEWIASWITMGRTDQDPLPIYRHSVELPQPVRHAVLHICGLGQYELRVNGQRVGHREMDPGWTNYRRTCLYSSYDVTGQLIQGSNVIGVLLGNGMYNVPGGRYVKFTGTFGPPKLICQLHITLSDGTTRIIASDSAWKCTGGPITFSCIYGGEDYDARREQTGWDVAGYDDARWESSIECQGPGGRLVAQTAPPIVVADTLSAVTFSRLADGSYEVDCGMNLSARPWIKVRGPAGSQVAITTAEQRGKPWPGHSYTYTLKGTGDELFVPRFTYFSFQYLYISGATHGADHSDTARPQLLEAGSEFLTSSARPVGAFQCSNALLNDIDAMITRSVRSNLQSVLTDCPHREKLGWLEVSHLMGPSIFYRYDAQLLYRKICGDTTESQLDSGLVPDIAPEYTRFQNGFFESAEWGSASVQLPWLLYRWYGDREILERQYDTMARYVRYLDQTCNEQGLAKPGLGDWYDWTAATGHVGASQLTPAELPATAMLYDNARILQRVAEMLGRQADGSEFAQLADRVQDSFQAAYYDPTSKTVATGSQAALATALYYDLVPDADRAAVLERLCNDFQRDGYRQTTGEVCFRMLVQVLARSGRSDLIDRMLNRTDAPGYGHMLKQGYKTLSESWDQPGSSMNHCMFGHAQEWFQESLLGIEQANDSMGFHQIVLRPEPVGDVTSAQGYFDCNYGRIASAWRIENGQFIWDITIPPNTTAEVFVPTTNAELITESDTPANQADAVRYVGLDPAGAAASSSARAIFSLGSGDYHFRSPWRSSSQP